jgi:uncharacterized BrkB/YihY/UPF0761 family membrane protein
MSYTGPRPALRRVIYGSLGTAIALLVFYLYLSTVALMLGEEVNAAINRGATDSAVQARGVEQPRETIRAENGGG